MRNNVFNNNNRMSNEVGVLPERNVKAILENKAWTIAKGPASSIFQTAFVSWMMGNQLSIYTLFFIVFALYNPIKGILGTISTFSILQQESTAYSSQKLSFFPQKLVFVFLNFLLLCVGLYKAYSMGLVPTVSELLLDPPVVLIPPKISIGIVK